MSGLVAADWAAANGVGTLHTLSLPLWAETAIAILAFSFQSWAVHAAMHHVPVLWRMHRVHHTDLDMDVSTTVRFHPFEIVLQSPVTALVAVAVGAPPLSVMLYGIADAGLNVFSHSNIRLPERLDRVLSRLIVTPHLHRVHHSTRPRETNSNFGATLPVWDQLFGTYRAKPAADLASQPIGLDEMQDARAYKLSWALTLPFRRIRRPEPSPTETWTQTPPASTP